MTSPSFTVKNYASKVFAVTFDIDIDSQFMNKNNDQETYEKWKNELARIQLGDGSFDRKLFLQSMYSDLIDTFGDFFSFNVHFMNSRELNKVYYYHYFDGKPCMGGYIEFFFPCIKTLPDMIEKLEEFSKRIKANGDDGIPIVKFVHLNVGTTHYSKAADYEDVHKLVVKDGVVHED